MYPVFTMKIGIDISQIAYEGTGVDRYVRNLVTELVKKDVHNTYILFASSLRKRHVFAKFYQQLPHGKVILRVFPFPPTLLTFLWNDLHIIPIEWLIGHIDIFWSSDWVQPPISTAIGITTIHDVSFLRYPESFTDIIVTVQKKRLQRAVSECKHFLCDSIATKKDVIHYYHLPDSQLTVVYPGISKL